MNLEKWLSHALKKVGKAHLRNKCKRRLKEAIRHYLNAFPQDRDCIFLASKYCQDTPLKELCDTINTTMTSLQND